ncbi:hypothetical protein C8R43DRAFT_943065 [Mycena crocata]|nr:hypothetical protein C8R43DRAFT_943065 [Mycena crocata]
MFPGPFRNVFRIREPDLQCLTTEGSGRRVYTCHDGKGDPSRLGERFRKLRVVQRLYVQFGFFCHFSGFLSRRCWNLGLLEWIGSPEDLPFRPALKTEFITVPHLGEAAWSLLFPAPQPVCLSEWKPSQVLNSVSQMLRLRCCLDPALPLAPPMPVFRKFMPSRSLISEPFGSTHLNCGGLTTVVRAGSRYESTSRLSCRLSKSVAARSDRRGTTAALATYAVDKVSQLINRRINLQPPPAERQGLKSLEQTLDSIRRHIDNFPRTTAQSLNPKSLYKLQRTSNQLKAELKGRLDVRLGKTGTAKPSTKRITSRSDDLLKIAAVAIRVAALRRSALEAIQTYLTLLQMRRRPVSWILAAQERDRMNQLKQALGLNALDLFTAGRTLGAREDLTALAATVDRAALSVQTIALAVGSTAISAHWQRINHKLTAIHRDLGDESKGDSSGSIDTRSCLSRSPRGTGSGLWPLSDR